MRSLIAMMAIACATEAYASGHGPLFGAATPTLGRGAWSFDTAWTARLGKDVETEQMLKPMVTFGITEVLQISASAPLLMSDGTLPAARMMNAMSNDREFEAILGYRFQRAPVGIGGRRESTLYVGGTVPTERNRNGLPAPASIVVSLATGYAGRTHYVWVGGGLQHYVQQDEVRFGGSRTITGVYGYRPAAFREVHDRPDLRFFVEATFEDRQTNQAENIRFRSGPRTLLIGPSSLAVYKAIAVEAGVQFAAYQRIGAGAKERMRAAVNFSYFWFR